MLKKVLSVLAVVIGLLIVGIIVIPFFVDVDKYRPQLIQQADQHLNGKLELGKLSLSLWGRIRIEIAGLRLLDAEGRPVLAVKDAYFHLPFASLLSGSPEFVLHMQQPELDIEKDRHGKLNVLSLVKTSSVVPASPGTPASAPPPAPTASTVGGEVTLPGIATRATLGMELENALVNYKDETSGMTSQVHDLNVKMENLSLSREMTLEISANLDTRMKGAKEGSQGMSLVGPVRITAKAKPTVVDGRFERVDVTAHADLDQLDMEMPPVFHKLPGIEANADLTVAASPSEVTIDRMDAKFFNAQLTSNGKITHLESNASPQVVYEMKSNPIELKPWVELVPMLKEYELGGSAELAAEAHGPSDKLSYKAEAKVVGLTAKAPNLKAQPRIDADLTVIPDKADLNATMKAPGNDLEITGSVVSFTRPQIRVEVSSSGMDLDQLVQFPPPGAKAASGTAATTGAGPTTSPAPATDYDALLAPIRANKSLALAAAHVNANIRSLKARGIAMSDISAKASFQSLVASIDSFTMKVFGGQVKSSTSVDLKPKVPDYRFTAAVQGLDLSQAVDAQMKAFRNTVTGKLAFDMSGTGRSLSSASAMENLKAKGKMRVENAEFTSIDVGKMVTEGINSAIGRVADKVPALKGKTVSANLPSGGSRYDWIAGSFTIANARFDAPDFATQASPNKGIDLKGNTSVGLKDQSLAANWEVIDTYNLTHAKDISVNEMGVTVDHVLAEKNGPVKFPVTVTGTLSAPQYNYGQVVEYLLKVAIANASAATQGAARAQLQNKANDLIKQAPPGLQNALKGLGSKLFGN